MEQLVWKKLRNVPNCRKGEEFDAWLLHNQTFVEAAVEHFREYGCLKTEFCTLYGFEEGDDAGKGNREDMVLNRQGFTWINHEATRERSKKRHEKKRKEKKKNL